MRQFSCVIFSSTCNYRFDAFFSVQTTIFQSSVPERTTLCPEHQNKNYCELITIYCPPAGTDFAIV